MGHKVTTRETLHFKGDDVSGTIEARYTKFSALR